MQNNINGLLGWSGEWLLKFNADKCKVLHLGKNNPKYEYTISHDSDDAKILEITVCEKDLGVHVDSLLNFNEHITNITKKGRSLSAMLVRNITFKEKDIMTPLFKGIVRPILEYANVVWSPYMLKDIKRVEDVQRHFTKYIVGMKGLSYQQRLKKLELPSLEFRRVRGDLIEVYKIVHHKYDPVITNTLFSPHENVKNTRTCNSLNLNKPSFNKKQYQMFFTNRVINLWNSIPEETVNAPTLNSFKNKIDKLYTNEMYCTRLEYLYKLQKH